MQLLKTIANPFAQDSNTLSVVLIGSGSRDELDVYSDLDFQVVVRGERPPDQMYYLENRLVNVNFLDVENRESMLHNPWKAMSNIAATREAQILFDPDGWYANLQERAKAFLWKTVEKDADIAISWVLAENAEIVQKILGGLSNYNLEKALHATVTLLNGLTDVGALGNGVLCNSENRFWSSVRDAEADATWKKLFWTALGFDAESVTTRAKATLGLYSRSFVLHQAKLLPEHLKIVQHVCSLIADSE
jgi:predicted nucleotidyltransferase